jgi:hypothetical protein
MKIRNTQTDPTSERMIVPMDFFLLMDARTWLICKVESKSIRCMLHATVAWSLHILDTYRRNPAADIAYLRRNATKC